ncbi:SDR family oxidoreductase [Fodinibius sediminis]|uniref:NADP-dependent 3-hydroxy acid dehydrogenase YdfG n=1 Tax=Fodinibius sediminis TaxID=1214077 RepID=A0A521CB86_9BACT|nr:SDR family NAD(P)-dependent oxidoreductase [Fodinibius sediminis]SMO56625.1 NADP-dependent 3-hydroxy acid dehydrogenase YdfG [Fodinibius sediminis]
MDITSKIAIVTGASSGIGAAFSQALVDKGATVYGLARSTDKLQRLQQNLGKQFHPVPLDITDHEAIDAWIQQTFNETLEPDILINNAGLGRFANVENLPLEDWEAMINTNLSGIFYMCRKVVPLMKDNENTCHIINIASIAGKVGNPQLSGYNASKFGVRGFSEALFKELRYDKIKVSCFYPGSIQTGFFSNANDSESHANMMQPEDVARVLINVLETPDNFLINAITMRPLNPKHPEEL